MEDPFQMLSVKDEQSNIRTNARQGRSSQIFGPTHLKVIDW